MANQLFERIKDGCQKKKVVGLCNKLSKKFSFKSGADCENLCHLAYWLYVYGEKDLAIECVALTRDVPFDVNYNVWTFIHSMWGLEMRLLREAGKEAEGLKIAETMNMHLLTPPKKLPSTPEEMLVREMKRRSRPTFEEAIRKEEVEMHMEENSPSTANEWRFVALLEMIGDAETGFYPQLNEHKSQIEVKIAEYISELAKVK